MTIGWVIRVSAGGALHHLRTGHQFATLDGLRGVAAIAVVSLHLWKQLGGVLLPHSYLAVDFFFVLSGFVLAHAYERRLLSDMPPAEFLRMRLIRLYPLYCIGALLGIVALAALGGFSWWKPRAAVSVVFTLAGLPDPRFKGSLYPFDPPAWSLFYEMIANAAFAVLIFRLTTKRLALIAMACLVIAAAFHGSLNTGYRWNQIGGGLARVGFGFFAGVLTYRLWQDTVWRPRIPSWCLGALLVSIFAAGQWPPQANGFDFLAVLLFPGIVYLGASQEPSRYLRPACLWLGGISYALYVIHVPLLWTCEAFGLPQTASGGLLALILAVTVASVLNAIDPLMRGALLKHLPHPCRTAIRKTL